MPSTLLCIDDDRAFVQALGASLRRGERLLHCPGPDEALAIVREQRPDLVVLEIRLAAGNGLDFVERMRGLGGRAGSTPVLVVSGSGQTPGIRSRAADLGVAAFLSKPVPAAQLAATVQDWLEKSRHRSRDANEDSSASLGIGSGRLSELPFPELLDRVHRRGESGVLIVGDARERTGIQIRNGSPVAVTLPRHEELDEFLLRTGRISEAERDEVLAKAALGPSSIGDILVGDEIIDEDTLSRALCEQADEAIFRLFELRRGRYRFEPDRRLRGARSLEVSRSTESIIARGVLAWQPLESIDAALGRYGDLYLTASSHSEPRFEDVPYSEAQRRFVGGLVGDRSVHDFLDASEFERRTLYAFTILGMIELSPDPMLVLDEAIAASAPTRRRESEPEPEEILLDDPDLSHEQELFAPRLGAPEVPVPAESAAGPCDLSHEDELFEARVFEEDSFENEMVSEPAPSENPDPGDSGGSLVAIERLLSGHDAVAEHDPLAPSSAPARDRSERAPRVRAEARPEPESPPAEKPAASARRARKTRAAERGAEPVRTRADRESARREPPAASDGAEAPGQRESARVEKAAPRKRRAAEAPAGSTARAEIGPRSAAPAESTDPRKTGKRGSAGRPAEPPAPDEKPSTREPVETREPAVAEAPRQDAQAPDAPEEPAAAETGTAGAGEAPAREEPAAAAAEPTAETGAAARKPESGAQKSYAIAPRGTIETNPQERALVAARVQQRVNRRYGHLVDRGQLQAEQAGPASSGGDDQASRALQAETWFRKGRELLKVKRYEQAVEAFGMCSHLDPSEGEYVAHLGYSLYLSKPDDELVRKEALEDIARGIKLSPDRELPYVYLGRIFKVQGDENTARKMFYRALKLRPHCREAAQEIRLMEMREKKKGSGLLSRLLK